MNLPNRVKDSITFENMRAFPAYITVGDNDGGDYPVAIEFIDPSMDDIISINDLRNKPFALKVSTGLLTLEKYGVSHLAIRSANSTSNPLTYTLNCLSDVPMTSLLP